MQDDDKTYRDTVVRLCELAGDEGVLQGLSFVNCEVRGPAVLGVRESIFRSNKWTGDPDSVLWEVPKSRPYIVGQLTVLGCTFEECTFVNVGYAGRPEEVQAMREMDIWLT